MRPTEVLMGAYAAFSLPAHLSGGRLRPLLADAPAVAVREIDPEPAMRVGLALLVRLARLRLPLWRNTCLFRSVLRCVLLRRAGRPAVLRIGARRSDGAGVTAHAWVEVAGERLWEDETTDTFTLLRGAAV